ncbi:MAG: hypothetical protein Q8Q15_03730 [bacterium]|nr:hypothetical protein [bacterium]
MPGPIERKPDDEQKDKKRVNGYIFAVVRPDGSSIIIDSLAPKPAYGRLHTEKNKKRKKAGRNKARPS